MDYYISYGAGVNSTAMTLLLLSKGLRYPIVFADTGGEWPETYDFLEKFKEFLKKEFDLQLDVVRKEPSLYDYLYSLGLTPSLRSRMCTDRWKVRPIQKKYSDRVPIIGWTAEEGRRVRRVRGQFWAPLYEKGITRADCVKIIERFGLTVPIKSSCWFCAFQSRRRWRVLKQRHPELFKKALELERRNKQLRGVQWGYKINEDLDDLVGNQLVLGFLQP